LDAVRETKGVVGLNFAVGFLREDGNMTEEKTSVEVMVKHLSYLVDRLGEDGVALGSDFDGATMPAEIGNASGLPALLNALRAAKFGDALIEKIAYKNWLNLLSRTIGD
jgi:membrane dipeptidase